MHGLKGERYKPQGRVALVGDVPSILYSGEWDRVVTARGGTELSRLHYYLSAVLHCAVRLLIVQRSQVVSPLLHLAVSSTSWFHMCASPWHVIAVSSYSSSPCDRVTSFIRIALH